MEKIHFLKPFEGSSTKKYVYSDGYWVKKSSYSAGKFYKGYEINVTNIKKCYEIIKTQQNTSCFFVHGGFITGINKSNMVRRIKESTKDNIQPTITNRDLHFFCLDVDGYKDHNDVDLFIRDQLPTQFSEADYIYQYSASYGLNDNSLKCHIFFWLKKAINNQLLHEWIKDYNETKDWGNILDPAALVATQPIYTQRRVCLGANDPVDNMIGFVKKNGELDWEPDFINKTPPSFVKKNDQKYVKKEKYDVAKGIKNIKTGTDYHNEINKLSMSLANRNLHKEEIKELVKSTMDDVATKDARWHERYNDIDRSVESAVDIIAKKRSNNVTEKKQEKQEVVSGENKNQKKANNINEKENEKQCVKSEDYENDIKGWIKSSDYQTVRTEFAERCVGLDPIQKTEAVKLISEKIGFGVNDIKKTIKIAEENEKERLVLEQKARITAERATMGIHEIEAVPTNTGDTADKVCKILANSEKGPDVYVMGNNLVSIDNAVPNTIRQCSKLDSLGQDYPKIPIIIPYRRPYYTLGGRIEKDVVFKNSKGKDIECPTKVLHIIGESTQKYFRPITGIVEHPFVDSSWDLVQKNGYNKKTGLYTQLHRKLKITDFDPDDAYEYLAYEVFDEFPFVSELDRAVAVAALMTAVQRPTISGENGMPGFGIVSPTQSSGKTTLAQLISYSIFNRPVAAATLSDEDAELEKHILGILQEGHSCVLFDNIKHGSQVTSDILAKAMSSESFSGRQLGENKTISVPTSIIWMFTGNGISFVGDFATRVYPITINPLMESPDTRKFRRGDIGQWAMDNRKKIISAVISIIKAGKNVDTGDLGHSRFKLWDKFVRRPLLAISGIDINEAVKSNQLEDPVYAAKFELLSQLNLYFPDSQEFSTKDVITQASQKYADTDNPLEAALEQLYGKRKNSTLSIGKYLSSFVGAVFGGMYLCKRVSNVVYWSIRKREQK